MLMSKNTKNGQAIYEYFKNYDDLIEEVNYRTLQLSQLKSNWYSLTGVRYDDIRVQGGKKLDIADQLHYIVEKEEELKELIERKNKLRKQHEEEINILDDRKKRSIMKLYYLDKCTIRQIAGCLHISDHHVKTLKRCAIEEFIQKNNTI